MQPGCSITGMSARKKLPSWLQRCHGDQTHHALYGVACGRIALEMGMIQTFIMPLSIVSCAWWFGVDSGGSGAVVEVLLVEVQWWWCSDSGGGAVIVVVQ